VDSLKSLDYAVEMAEPTKANLESQLQNWIRKNKKEDSRRDSPGSFANMPVVLIQIPFSVRMGSKNLSDTGGTSYLDRHQGPREPQLVLNRWLCCKRLATV
jgi:hypothetical protein